MQELRIKVDANEKNVILLNDYKIVEYIFRSNKKYSSRVKGNFCRYWTK